MVVKMEVSARREQGLVLIWGGICSKTLDHMETWCEVYDWGVAVEERKNNIISYSSKRYKRCGDRI